MNIFNEAEFIQICKRVKVESHVEGIVINYPTAGFFNKMKKSIETDRRGEVAFCVIRPNGKIITVTCSEYPEGIFRIPTGGIGHKEDILEAVFREAKEELGLETEIEGFLGVLKTKFVYQEESCMFYSYLFLLREVSGRLLLDATDDEVSEIREVKIEELEEIARLLRNIDGKWADWGNFRFETTNAYIKYLKNIM